MRIQWAERVGRRIKLRDMHILLAVAQSGSMGKAALDLGVSQPAIWKSLADLEGAVGVRLLERSRQGVEPTTHGRALLKCSIAVFDELQRGVKELEFLSDPTAGELRIGCTEPLAAGFVASIIDLLSKSYPNATVHVVPGDRSTLLNRELRQRRIELAVMPTEGVDLAPDSTAEDLFDDRHVVMAGTRSKWIQRRKIALSELIDEPWVLPPPDSIAGNLIVEAFRACGLPPPQAHVVTFSVPLHCHLLATGRFLTMLPLSMVHLGKHLPIKSLPVQSLQHRRPIGIVTLRRRTVSPLARLFIDCARDVAKPFAKGQSK
jgi:DNA-binding transcriptional LysR family regulator